MSPLSSRVSRRARTRSARRAEQGQVLAIFGMSISVLLGLAGLALDTAHGRGTQLQDQYIADATSISVAHLWKGEAGTTATSPPANPSTDPAILAAQQLANHNRLWTNSFPCVVSSVANGSTVDDVVFYGDGSMTPPAPPDSCGTVPPAYRNRVEESIPPTLPQAQWPTACNSPYWSCVQVTTTQVEANYLFGILGVSSSTIVATSISTANIPPTLLNPPVPPPFAEMSFEKATNFKTVNGYPGRGTYGGNCTNCSSHWNSGVETQILGYDWAIQCTGTAATCDHGVATATAPAIVGTGGRTEYCDTFQANACTSTATLGNYGLAMQSTVYCGSGVGGGALCDTSLPPAGGVFQEPPAPNYPTGALDGSTWLPPIISFASAPDCGTLVLNGEAVNDSFLHQGSAARSGCAATAAEPYIIQPRRYSSIVINYGHYQFAPGNYDLYGTGAPVNTKQSGWANGIDHSNETAVDWDLCQGGTVTSCQNLTASLWIGHGSSGSASVTKGANNGGLSVGTYSPGSYPACGSTSDYQAAGGGDATQVLGRGVYFQFESNGDTPADGFVSTHEVSEVSLDAPPLGTSAALSGVPMLFAVESDFAAVHLDGPGYTAPGTMDNANGFFGLIWTIHKGNTGAGSSHPLGGVEMNPGLAGTATAWTPGNTAGGYHPALYGQIVADSVAYFGSAGTAVDFSNGWGTVLPVATPDAQRRIDPFLLEQLYVAPSPTPGYEQVSVLYSGYTAMDGFSSFITVKGQPIYPSRPVWNYVAAQPPPNNNPGDAHAADPSSAGFTATSNDKDGFTAYSSGQAAGKYYSIGGDFVWGHQGAASPASALPFGEHGFITYQFPTVPDPTITVSWLLVDGTTSRTGFCGNSTSGTLTFSNVGSTAKGVNLGAPPQVVG